VNSFKTGSKISKISKKSVSVEFRGIGKLILLPSPSSSPNSSINPISPYSKSNS
jgi:hypothetical protein